MPRILHSLVILLAAVFCLPALVNAAVGYTPGSFNVSNTGAATYSIPIAVPPGTAGMQPSLSLAYSSQSGNGLVGMGFSLQGLSAITRCPQTRATDGSSGGVDLSTNDRYCLDGQRLIAINSLLTYNAVGQEYRTEVDSLTKIIAYGPAAGSGPSYFIAMTKSGQTIQYGSTTDARILASGTTTVLVWAADTITDTAGNYLTMRYCNYGTTTYCAESYTGTPETGEFFPARIDYAGNTAQVTPTSSSVLFVYATRTDISTGYVGGSTVTSSVRLANILVNEGTSNIRDYRMTYDGNQANTMTKRSRLTALTECDSNLSGANCLPATTFSWSTDGVGLSSTPISTGISVNAQYTQAIDVNGDGKVDLAYCLSTTDKWKIAFSNGAGFNTPIDTGITCTNYTKAKAIYYNSDGLMDLLVPYASSQWYVLISNGSTFLTPVTTALTDAGKANHPQVIDVNGDGRADFMQDYSLFYHISINSATGLAAEYGSASTNYNSPNYNYMSSSAQPLDYNGDGRTDLLLACGLGHWHILLSDGVNYGDVWNIASTGTYVNASNANYPQLTDINGDGRPDFVYTAGGYWKFRLNTGANFSSTEITTTIPNGKAQYAKPIDYNGDGKMDLLVPGSLGGIYTASNWYVMQSTGSGFTVINTGIPNTGYTSYPQLADVNGDGLPDLLYYSNGWQLRLHNVGSNQNQVPDLLINITNGLGAQAAITYKPLTDSTVYTKGYGGVTPTFPQQDFQGPMYVVSEYTTSDGIGGSYPVTYSYTGARIDVQGRGFVGFSLITATDTVTGISKQTTYSQAWPTSGMVTSIFTVYGGVCIDACIHAVVNTPAYKTYGTAKPYYYYFPYLSRTDEYNYELPGGFSNIVSTTTTTNTTHSSCATYDYYCDLTGITVTTTAGSNTYTKTTTNTYDTPNTSSWILGRLNNAKVTSTLPSGSTLTRESSFTYNPTSGLILTETVEPNGNIGTITNLKQPTTYTYDNYGNKDSATVSGADITSRATYMDYTTPIPATATPGRFLYKTTNALGQTETHEYDARFGTMTKLTGPNSLSTQWEYDNFGRKTLETRADGTTTGWTYTLCGTTGCPTYAKYYVIQTTSGAPTVIVYYDLLDREVRTQTQGYNGTAIYKDTVYNNLGQVAKVSRPYYSSESPWWTYFSYDALGRAISQSLPTQASVAGNPLGTTSYSGLTTTVTQYRDGTALTTTQVKDALGQLVSVTDADTETTYYEYDPFGNLTRVTDPAFNATSMTYDIRGRKLNMTDPDMGHWQYAYNSVGELKKQTDARGKAVDMTYDDLGRLSTRNEEEGLTTWTYDDTAVSGSKAKGKLSKVTWPGSDRTYTYDDYGRPKEEKTTLSGTTFTLTTAYDPYSRLDTITYPSTFAVRNKYNPYGYLESVTNAATAFPYWNAPAYNAAGQTTAFTLGNGLTTVNQYDPATGLLNGISTGVGAASATQYLTYIYDTLGNVKSRTDGNQANLTENFTYDNLNRLLTAAIVGGGTKSVTYDSIGNITSKSDIGTYTYDPLHKHAVKTAGTGTYTYDANGNQLTGPSGRLISYTSFNQPLSIAGNGKTDTFTYDGDHQRVTMRDANGTNTIYVHPRIDLGAHYEQETKLNGVVAYKSYVYAGKETIGVYTTRSAGLAPDMRYFHKDHLGSIDTITDETGNVAVDANGKQQRFSYDAWGKRRNGNWTDATSTISSLTHHGFTGHEMLDDVGLINMNGRLYAPGLGRFLQADPTVQAPGNPQTLNRYSYAGNNPLTYVDPSGYGFFSSLFKIFKAVVIAVIAVYTFNFIYGALIWSSVGAAIGSVGVGMIAGAAAGFVGGFLGSGGNVQAGMYGALGGAISGGVYGYAEGASWAVGSLNRVLAHAAGGGVSSVLQGQKFGPGAASAGFTQTFAPMTPNAPGGGVGRVVAAAVVGGTASTLGGGKFANGASTFGFMRLFGEAADYYQRAVGRPANGLPGQNRPGLTRYIPDENGRQLPTDQSMGVIGLNREMDGTWRDFFTQGGPLSKGLNVILTMNATGGLHDYWFNDGNPNKLDFTLVNNIGAMLPAAGISTGAVLGNLSQGWETNPMLTSPQ